MQQNIKKTHFFNWLTILALSTVLFFGCNDTKTNAEDTKADTIPVEKPLQDKATPDSLPPVDSTSSTRPEPRKT